MTEIPPPSIDVIVFITILAGLATLVLFKTKKLIGAFVKLAVAYSVLVAVFGAVHVARRHGGDFDSILKGGDKSIGKLLHVILHSSPAALFVCYLGGLVTPKVVRNNGGK